MFRTRLRVPRQALGQSLALRSVANSTRTIHQVPKLPHDFSEGIPNLMSPGGFMISWTHYMSLMVEKLNALTAGTELEGKDTKNITLMTARKPNQAPIFNYASMAHNNHFFFQGITPTGTPMPDALRADLEASFSSLDTLRREFVVTAASMFGPGFVWLVRAGPGDYRILTTYLAGSPYPGAHWRAQSSDVNTLGADGSAKTYLQNQAFGARKRKGSDLPPGGIELEPLLCLNTWEHVWLLDWGVGNGGEGGKMAFAEAWWELIDWEKVAERAIPEGPQFKTATTS